MLRLSQGHLNLLELCPRKFQHQVLEQLLTPPSPEQQGAMRWGDRFHILMQQHSLGLPIAALVAEDPTLQQTVTQLQQQAPHLFETGLEFGFESGLESGSGFSSESSSESSSERSSQSEHPRSLNLHGYPVTVIYDRLITTPTHAEILDWKTHLRPRSVQRLAQDWQTRLYCYVLAETSNYTPEQIRMTYWFVRAQSNDSQFSDSPPSDANPNDANPIDFQRLPQPQSYTLAYSRATHLATQQRLHHWITQLDQWLQHPNPRLPQVDEAVGHCSTCPFAERCQRVPGLNAVEDSWSDDWQAIATIAEIPI